MQQLTQIVAGIGLALAGLTAIPMAADARPRVHADRYADGPRDWRDDDRRWNDRRQRHDRRAWNERRRGDDRRDRYGYRGDRIIHGGSREAAAMGVQYLGPCRIIIRNGRRVCG